MYCSLDRLIGELKGLEREIGQRKSVIAAREFKEIVSSYVNLQN